MSDAKNKGPLLGLDQNMGIKAADVRKRIGELSNQPKILFIGGTHPRHLYYANKIHERYPLAGAVLQDRGSLLPHKQRKGSFKVMGNDDLLWIQHFGNRAEAEIKYFGYQEFPDTEVHLISKHGLEFGEVAIGMVKGINPDIVLIFGCGMIKGELAKALPELTINLHLGLSPRYRGAATLFWPFYFLEPQWAGCTFHKIVDEPDAGDILHQCVPELERGDKIHDVACKAVGKATFEMIELLGMYTLYASYRDTGGYIVLDATSWWDSGPPRPWEFHPQRTTGKNFLSRDFQPSHLRMIYETYNDDIVDQYLDGNLKQHKPKLVRQF